MQCALFWQQSTNTQIHNVTCDTFTWQKQMIRSLWEADKFILLSEINSASRFHKSQINPSKYNTTSTDATLHTPTMLPFLNTAAMQDFGRAAMVSSRFPPFPNVGQVKFWNTVPFPYVQHSSFKWSTIIPTLFSTTVIFLSTGKICLARKLCLENMTSIREIQNLQRHASHAARFSAIFACFASSFRQESKPLTFLV